MCQISNRMDKLQLIQSPIGMELNGFIELFDKTMCHTDGLLGSVLRHVRERGGKRMRPILTLLLAKNFGGVTEATLHAAVSLELLHTASLVHDDVVDESNKRRGQASVNALFGNKVAVLVGDYVLSTALQIGASSVHDSVVAHLADLGKTLSDGEIIQLQNVRSKGFSEESYYEMISKKTAVLFEKCTLLGAETGGADPVLVEAARMFGHNIGMIFQIRDDIFDYFDSKEIGKPTGNDLFEGKLTLPLIHVLTVNPDQRMLTLVDKVKGGNASNEEIGDLIAFAKQNGGIEYADKIMQQYYDKACTFISEYVKKEDLKTAFQAYLDFVIQRKY